jgi:hypothetical protein
MACMCGGQKKSPVGVEVGATRVEVRAGVVLAVPTQHMRSQSS